MGITIELHSAQPNELVRLLQADLDADPTDTQALEVLPKADLSLHLRMPHWAGATWCGSSIACKPHFRGTRSPTPRYKTPSTNVRPLMRQVAAAFPLAQLELWAMDEQRIGLKPLLLSLVQRLAAIAR